MPDRPLLLTRRFLLAGMLAAPAIVRVGSLMPLRGRRLARGPFPGELWWDPLSDTLRAWDGTTWAQLRSYGAA